MEIIKKENGYAPRHERDYELFMHCCGGFIYVRDIDKFLPVFRAHNEQLHIMEKEGVEFLFIDGERKFWWPFCSVSGCANGACLSASSDKCHVHTFTKWHHKLMRAIRSCLNKITFLL